MTISIVRTVEGYIKTFSEKPSSDYNQVLGETVELLETTFQEYASRFVVSCQGRSGETIQIKRNSGDLFVDIDAPGTTSIDVSINKSIETLTPPLGVVYHLTLGTENAGVFVIEPADRKTFCAAGEGKLVIEVLP